MDQNIYRKVSKHQSQLQRLESTIERCKHSLLDVQNLLDSLKESNKSLMDIAAKTANEAKPYNRGGKLYAPSNKGSASAKKQKDAKPYNCVKQYTASASTSQRSTSSRKQNTDNLENLFKKVYIQDKHFERHPKNNFKK